MSSANYIFNIIYFYIKAIIFSFNWFYLLNML